MLTLALLLVAGAIVNVAVAWGCAAWLPIRAKDVDVGVSDADLRWLGRYRAAENISDPSGISVSTYVGSFAFDIKEIVVVHMQFDNVTPFHPLAVITRAGFPLKCFEGGRTFGAGLAWNKMTIHGAIEFERGAFGSMIHRDIPTEVILSGFAINTTFYAAILWMMFFVPGKVKRSLRRRRGLCPACAYPVGTSSVCTECGAAIQPRRGDGM